MASFVKTYGELNREALRLGCDRELVVWYLLRHIDASGCGRVRLEAVFNGAGASVLTRPNLKRRLARGDGRFWAIHATTRGQVIHYKSLETVCELLDVQPYRDPVGIPLRALRRLGTARAHLYAAWVKDKQIARKTITELTALSPDTQRRYGDGKEGRPRIRHQKNVAVREYQRGDQLAPGRWVARSKGVLLYNVRMSNTYLAELPTYARGQLRKVRRSLRSLKKVRPVVGEQRYFHSAMQALKCRNRANPFYIDRRRTWHGAHLWDACAV